MSMESIKRNQDEELVLFASTASKERKSPVTAYSLATSQLESLVALAEQTHGGHASSEADEDAHVGGSRDTASQSSSSNDGIQFNKQSVFQASKVMQEVQKAMGGSLAEQLQEELAVLQQQMQTLKVEEQFWEKFSADWNTFMSKHSNADDYYAAFKKVIADLEAELKDDPGAEAQLKLLEILGASAFSSEKSWESHTGFGGDIWKFFHGELSDPKFFTNFINKYMSEITGLAAEACGGQALFNSALTNGTAAFESRIEKLILTIDIITRIVKVLESSNPKTAMFEMDAILMDIEQLQMNGDVQRSQQQQDQNKITAENLKSNLDKIEKALKEQAHKSSGLFGWIEDLFKSLFNLLKSLVMTVYYNATGNTEAAKKYEKTLEKPFETLKTAVMDLFNGHFKEGLELLVTAVVLSIMFGPAGLALMGSKFGDDINDMTKLVVDAVVALGEAIVAGLAKAAGDDKLCKQMLDSAKKLGEAMLANPALKVLGDIAMVVIIIASVISQQYWLAAVMVVLFVMSESGLLEKATNAIANSIEKDMGGKNSALAKVIADIIVIAIITVLSMGAGAAEAAIATGADTAAAAGEEAASAAADAASDAASNSADEEASTAASQAADESASEGTSRAAQIAKRAASMGAFGFGSVLGSSSLVMDILEATNKKDDKTLAIILEIIQVIVAAVAAALGGASTISQTATQMGKTLEEGAAEMSQLASKFTVSGTAVQAVAGAGQGGEAIIQAHIEELLQDYKGNATLDEATMNNVKTMIDQTEQDMKHLIAQYENIIQTAFKAPSELEAGEQQALLQA